MGHKDLESAHDLGERDRAVILPFLHRLDIVDHDDKVFIFALVVDFGLGAGSASHIGMVLDCMSYWD